VERRQQAGGQGSESPRHSAGYRHHQQHAVFNNFKMAIKTKRKGGEGVFTTHLATGGVASGPAGRVAGAHGSWQEAAVVNGVPQPARQTREAEMCCRDSTRVDVRVRCENPCGQTRRRLYNPASVIGAGNTLFVLSHKTRKRTWLNTDWSGEYSL
jgi:hypothetical protein